jgi:uncharacterized Tic20 family protein
MDTYENLERLKQLLHSGAITLEEYEREKAIILSNSTNAMSQPNAQNPPPQYGTTPPQNATQQPYSQQPPPYSTAPPNYPPAGGVNRGWDLGIEESTFVALMHASQFLSSFVIPLIAWLLYRDKSKKVDDAGKNILNFELSFLIYTVVPLITCLFAWVSIIVAVVWMLLVVIAIIKAANNELWPYPLTVKFIK